MAKDLKDEIKMISLKLYVEVDRQRHDWATQLASQPPYVPVFSSRPRGSSVSTQQ